MQIQYTKTILKGQIQLDVEAQDFSEAEIAAFQALGDPVLQYRQECGSGQLISLKRHIYSELKFSQLFHAEPLEKDSVSRAITDANIFMEQFKVTVEQLMQTLMKNYADLQDKFTAGTVTVPISD